MRVDACISDLFFNTDLSDAKVYDNKGMFSHFNEDALAEAADSVIFCLDRLGVATPTRDELIADFYDRL